MKGGLLYQKLLSYTRFYFLACTMYDHKDKRTRRESASQDFVVWKLAVMVNCFEYHFY